MARAALSDDAVVKKATTDFVPVLVDYDVEKELVSSHGIQSIPAIVYADHDLEFIDVTIDNQPAETLLEDMQGALEDFHSPPEEEEDEDV